MMSAVIIAVAVLVSWVLNHDYRVSSLEQRFRIICLRAVEHAVQIAQGAKALVNGARSQRG